MIVKLESFNYFGNIALEIQGNQIDQFESSEPLCPTGFYWKKCMGRILYGLFTFNEGLYFFEGNKCIEVTDEDFHATVSLRLIIFGEFNLYRNKELILKIKYLDLFSSTKDSGAAHFFVDCAHFLKGQKEKKDFLRYWQEQQG
ncbi:hypothetical protein [Pseudoalteromonas luteoviolacea]|uniref:hypothetical protein n=1 Tax=Pseudoalteromonas luteoviolacea TaxID=43657 RepID=UPI001153FEA6|nr:hypothetical protein [Pseudoalteromonas luteoviolacea]TQF70198.1 hypothetical protein FLM44_03660 [Pseudoalteromonas luteoviolacea]